MQGDVSRCSDLSNSLVDVRRASEQLSPEAIKHFARSVPISGLYSSSVGPLAPTGLWKYFQISDRATAYRNLLGISISFFVCGSALAAEVGLQSSLNPDQGLGLASILVLCTAGAVSVFFGPPILKLLGTKYSVVIGYVGMLIFTLSSYYPSWYTLMPGSAIVGFTVIGVVFPGLHGYINVLAVRSALTLKEDPKYVISLFTGIFTFFYKVSYIPGNVISSIVLFNTKQVNISVDEDNGTCNNMEAANLDELYVYIMLSVFVLFDMVGIAIAVFLVDDLRTTKRFVLTEQIFTNYFVKPLKAMMKIFISWNMLLLVPVIVLYVSTISVLVGIYAKVYISDCIGVRWVGLVLMTYGICSGVGGFFSGRMMKHIPHHFIAYPVLIVFLAALVFLLSWERTSLHYVIFAVPAILGMCEAALNCITSSLVGILFPNDHEAAFSVDRFWYGLGSSLAFFYALFVSVNIQFWLLIANLAVSVITYTILTLKISSMDQLFPCLASKSKKPVVNSGDA